MNDKLAALAGAVKTAIETHDVFDTSDYQPIPCCGRSNWPEHNPWEWDHEDECDDPADSW